MLIGGGDGATGNTVQGNYIGTDGSGSMALADSGVGVLIYENGSDNLIGGTDPGAGNLISGNTIWGVFMIGDGVTGNLVQGNLIGTDATGMQPLGNSPSGVYIGADAAYNLIGGMVSGAGNTIAFNAGVGVTLGPAAGSGNALLSNSVFSNEGLGIDLGDDGVTPNDPRDDDAGPNDLQNFPVLGRPVKFFGTIRVTAAIWGMPNSTYRIELFQVTTCDDSGYGEGDTFLGSQEVTTAPSGFAAFVFPLPPDFPMGGFVTATATDEFGSTSEFSRCAGPVKQIGRPFPGGFGDGTSSIRLPIRVQRPGR